MPRDGPLTRRAPETIRYGTGRGALGALLVASSARGIVRRQYDWLEYQAKLAAGLRR